MHPWNNVGKVEGRKVCVFQRGHCPLSILVLVIGRLSWSRRTPNMRAKPWGSNVKQSGYGVVVGTSGEKLEKESRKLLGLGLHALRKSLTD